MNLGLVRVLWLDIVCSYYTVPVGAFLTMDRLSSSPYCDERVYYLAMCLVCTDGNLQPRSTDKVIANQKEWVVVYELYSVV